MKHIYDLNALLRDFVTSDFYDLHIEKDAEMFQDAGSGANFLRFDIDTSSFDLITAALIMGMLCTISEVLWTSCTTKLLSDAAALRIKRLGSQSKTRQELEGTLKGTLKEKQISTYVHDFILNTIKPYKAGNFPIWAVDDMNIMDKHQLLIPNAQAYALSTDFALRTTRLPHSGRAIRHR